MIRRRPHHPARGILRALEPFERFRPDASIADLKRIDDFYSDDPPHEDCAHDPCDDCMERARERERDARGI